MPSKTSYIFAYVHSFSLPLNSLFNLEILSLILSCRFFVFLFSSNSRFEFVLIYNLPATLHMEEVGVGWCRARVNNISPIGSQMFMQLDYVNNTTFVSMETGIFTSSLYAEDCIFEDPTIRFQGISETI